MTLATLLSDVEEVFRRPTGVRLYEKEDAFVLEAITAGVKAADINITFEKGTVCIEAKAGAYSYSYLVPLPTLIDETATPVAISEDGILKVTFPKAKVAKPFKILVKTV